MRHPNTPPRLTWLALLAAVALLLALSATQVVAQNPLNAEAVTARPIPGRLGSLSCASATCHGRLEPRAAVSGMARQEFIHWTTADPHARAGARILEKPFQDVLNRLVNQYAPSNPSAEQKAEIRSEVYRKCAACHDEAGIAEQKRRKDAGEELKLDDFEAPRLAHGIDCESCHGGSERWLAVHYQAWVPKALLLEMGMVDTDDLVGRAQQCTSCHVGGAGKDITGKDIPAKDMNHDMIAAGHPPLRFELSAYHAVIQRKHWDERKVRQLNPDYDIHLWQAGQWASAQATAELLAERAAKAHAKPAGDPASFTFPAPWPEFAEYNCFSCHQQLRAGSGTEPLWTKRSTDPRGVPAWGGWNTLPLELFVGRNSSMLPAPANENPLLKIQTQMAPFVGVDPAASETAAQAALTHFRASAAEPIQQSLPELLNGVTPLKSQDDVYSWEALAHRYLLLAAAQRTLRSRLLDLGSSTDLMVRSLTEPDELQIPREKLGAVQSRLGFTASGREWPRIYPHNNPQDSAGSPLEQRRQVVQDLDEVLATMKRALAAKATK